MQEMSLDLAEDAHQDTLDIQKNLISISKPKKHIPKKNSVLPIISPTIIGGWAASSTNI
jgi:hypothetical protein